MYGVTSVLLGALPLVALGAGLAVIGWAVRDTRDAGRRGRCPPSCGCRWPTLVALSWSTRH